jgi:hypothetical protein
MNQLQQEAKPHLLPLLHGEEISLHRKAQTSIAAWVTMMAMVSEFIGPVMEAVPQSDREWLRSEFKPPSHWRVWIGSHKRHRYPLWSHNVATLVDDHKERFPVGEIPKPNTQTSTVLVGSSLVIHSMSSTIARHLVRRWKLPSSIATSMSQIWPIREPKVSWPQGVALDDSEIQVLADHFFDRVHRQAVRKTLTQN